MQTGESEMDFGPIDSNERTIHLLLDTTPPLSFSSLFSSRLNPVLSRHPCGSRELLQDVLRGVSGWSEGQRTSLTCTQQCERHKGHVTVEFSLFQT